MPLCVWLESSSTRLARPKSAILGTVVRDQWSAGSETCESASRLRTMDDWLPTLARRMFAGLRSRWTMPRWWATSMVRASVSTSWAAARGTRRALADPLVETAPLDELQREIRPAFVLAGLVNLHDVGMRELGDGLGLGAEPRQAHRSDVRPGQDHLQGDQALQPPVRAL